MAACELGQPQHTGLVADRSLGARAAQGRAVDEDGFEVCGDGEALVDALGRLKQMGQGVPCAGTGRGAVVKVAANVQRADALAAGVQEVLRLGQAVRGDFELGLDDASAPGVRGRVANAAEEGESVCRKQPFRAHRFAIGEAEVDRVDFEGVAAFEVVEAIRKARCQQAIGLFGQDELAAGRPGRAEMRENHQLCVRGGHRDQKSSSSSSVALRSRTRWVRSRAARAASAGSDSDSRSSSVLPGAMASR